MSKHQTLNLHCEGSSLCGFVYQPPQFSWAHLTRTFVRLVFHFLSNWTTFGRSNQTILFWRQNRPKTDQKRALEIQSVLSIKNGPKTVQNQAQQIQSITSIQKWTKNGLDSIPLYDGTIVVHSLILTGPWLILLHRDSTKHAKFISDPINENTNV